MSAEQNKATMKRFYEEIVDKGRLELIEELVADNFVDHEAFPGLSGDRAGLHGFLDMMRGAFPDFSMRIEDLIAEGDRVVARTTTSGTHEGEFMGIAPSGKRIQVQGIDIVRFADGKAVEHWGVTDQASMMEQLGVAPAAAV